MCEHRGVVVGREWEVARINIDGSLYADHRTYFTTEHAPRAELESRSSVRPTSKHHSNALWPTTARACNICDVGVTGVSRQPRKCVWVLIKTYGSWWSCLKWLHVQTFGLMLGGVIVMMLAKTTSGTFSIYLSLSVILRCMRQAQLCERNDKHRRRRRLW